MWRIFLSFFKLLSPSVCLHLFVSVFLIFLSADSIITTIKRLLKISITKVRLMLLCCQRWHEHSTITLDGCSVAEVDPKMKGTFCTFKRMYFLLASVCQTTMNLNSWGFIFLVLFFPETFLGFNLEWKKTPADLHFYFICCVILLYNQLFKK